MILDEWLKYATAKIQNSGIDTPNLDAEILLSNAINKDRSWLIAHSDQDLAESVKLLLDTKLNRRCLHEPIAYILGEQEFYGRLFYVDKTVLVPRPESESVIELFKSLSLPDTPLVADVGCGSGALGITAYLERPGTRVYFLDIDIKVFTIAKKNARFHALRGQQYYRGDLLEARPEKYDVLLCNLPYVPINYPVNEAAKFEPRHALYSGKDGLEHFRRLFGQLNSDKFGTPVVICESLPEQHLELALIAKECSYELHSTDGFAQLFRPLNYQK